MGIAASDPPTDSRTLLPHVDLSQHHVHHVLTAIRRVRERLPRSEAFHADHRRRGDELQSYRYVGHGGVVVWCAHAGRLFSLLSFPHIQIVIFFNVLGAYEPHFQANRNIL